MPPHCDTLDGPVVLAARKALDTGNVNWVLPWVHEGGEQGVKDAFVKALAIRKLKNKDASDLADLWFFETTVRIHREGEGAPYTGIKPAGLDNGPIIPLVDKALETESPKEIVEYLSHTVDHAIHTRFEKLLSRRKFDPNDVKAARAYVQAFLGLTLFSHHLYLYIKNGGEHGTEEFDEPGKPHTERSPAKSEHSHGEHRH